ncbi:TPR-like protein [Trametopsis cervina]|nr:TPR-like protein [Trametopsis cervina]
MASTSSSGLDLWFLLRQTELVRRGVCPLIRDCIMTAGTVDARALLRAIRPTDFLMLCDRGKYTLTAPDFRLPLDVTMEYYVGLLKIEQDKGEIWRVLGDCYLMQDDIPKAHDAYIRAMCLLPNPTTHWKLWYGVGIMYEHYGYLDYAEAVFSRAFSSDEHRFHPEYQTLNETLYRLGILYMQRHKHDQSLSCFELIIRYRPHPLTYADVGFRIGEVHQRKGNYSQALEAYEHVLKRNPRHPGALQQIGWLYQQRDGDHNNDLKLAIHYLRLAVDTDIPDVQSWYFLGSAYVRAHDYERADEAYNEAIRCDPDNFRIWQALGELYVDTLRYTNAIDMYRRAIQIEPRMSELWLNLGSLYAATGHTSEAIEAYEKATRLNPQDINVTLKLGMLKSARSSGERPTPEIRKMDRMPPWTESTPHQPTNLPGPPFRSWTSVNTQRPIESMAAAWGSLPRVWHKDESIVWGKYEGRRATAADIPVELFEAIIHNTLKQFTGKREDSKEHIQTLRTFSLVALSWARFARPLMWRVALSVRLQTSERAKTFRRISLTGSSRMPRVIDMVEAIVNIQSYENEPWLHLLFDIGPIIAGKRTYLELRGPVPSAVSRRTSPSSLLWGSPYNSVQARYILRHINDVLLEDIHFSRLSQLVQLMRHFSYAQSFRFVNVTWDETDAPIPRAVTGKRRARLGYIYASRCTDNPYAVMVAHAVDPQVALQNASPMESKQIANFLQKMNGGNTMSVGVKLDPTQLFLTEEFYSEDRRKVAAVEITCSLYAPRTAYRVTGILVCFLGSPETTSDVLLSLIELADSLPSLRALAVVFQVTQDHLASSQKHEHFIPLQRLRDGVAARVVCQLPRENSSKSPEYTGLNPRTGETWKSNVLQDNSAQPWWVRGSYRMVIPSLLGDY